MKPKSEIEKKADAIRLAEQNNKQSISEKHATERKEKLADILQEFEIAFKDELPLLKEAGITYSAEFKKEQYNTDPYILFQLDGKRLKMEFNDRSSYRYEYVHRDGEYGNMTFGKWSKDRFILFIDEELLQKPIPKSENVEVITSTFSDIQQLYLSGPCTGIPDWNAPLFESYEFRFISKGFSVLNPHRIVAHLPQDKTNWEVYMKVNVSEMLKADVIALLPNWKDSEGAIWEFFIATRFGIKVVECDTFTPPVLTETDWQQLITKLTKFVLQKHDIYTTGFVLSFIPATS